VVLQDVESALKNLQGRTERLASPLRGRILIVDDDPSDLAVALRAFRKAALEHEVVLVRSGEAALDFLRGTGPYADGGASGFPQVIFLDLRMPGADGWAVLRELRADEALRDIPVVVVSSSRRAEDVRESYRLGANSYIAKRYDPLRPGAYLVEAARYWLSLNRPVERRPWEPSP
jgi:CheY-like chemotaxis protein